MDIRIIDPQKIDLGRELLIDEVEFAKKTALFNKHGQIDVVILNDSRLVDGFFTVRWAQRVGKPFVHCMCFKGLNRLEEIELIMHYNRRREIDVIFFAKLLDEYLQEGGTISSLANRVALTPEELRNMIDLLKFDWDSKDESLLIPEQLSLF